MNQDTITSILARARAERRRALLETEGLQLLDAVGISRPRHRFLRNSADATAIDSTGLTGSQVVVKVVSSEILHKSDLGGVVVVPNTRVDIATAIRDMETQLAGHELAGFLVLEFIRHPSAFGGELLASIRWTAEYGPVVTVGAGGVATEFLARDMREGREAAFISPSLPPDSLEATLRQASAVQFATSGFRGRPPLTPIDQISEVASRLMALAPLCGPGGIAEFEVNPLATTPFGPVALDVLVTLADPAAAPAPPRPLHKIDRLLHPRSIAIVGVSQQRNPGRIILDNMLRDGFDPSKIFVVKPDTDQIAGCRCCPDIASLPGRVDLLVVAVGADKVPALLNDVARHEKAESIIVIPGGLEEKQGAEPRVNEMRKALEAARATAWHGPVINGGNCLGIRSRPGRYDTMFIPEYKMPPAAGPVSPVALVAQSGAFAIARASRIGRLNPRYVISIGNQTDLTVGDYLAFLKDDPTLDIFAVYVEGFRPLDGLKCLQAAREIRASGRTVIFYRAGRTTAGARATASHTASIAGDYRVTRALCAEAGVIVAETLADFDDLVLTCTLLRDRKPEGRRLAAVSNAGFESVAMADNVRDFELPRFSDETRRRLGAIFAQARIDGLVDVQNPLDLTPMAADAAYEAVVRQVLADAQVDLGIVGCVPMTGALQTLPASARHPEDLTRSDSVVTRLAKLRSEIAKPWVAVVDAGSIYDPMAEALELAAIPTFRTADRAMRILGLFCSARARSLQPRLQHAAARAL